MYKKKISRPTADCHKDMGSSLSSHGKKNLRKETCFHSVCNTSNGQVSLTLAFKWAPRRNTRMFLCWMAGLPNVSLSTVLHFCRASRVTMFSHEQPRRGEWTRLCTSDGNEAGICHGLMSYNQSGMKFAPEIKEEFLKVRRGGSSDSSIGPSGPCRW